MSSTYQPTGLRAKGRSGEAPYEGALQTFLLTTNNTANIAAGDPVALVGGSIVALAGNPVSGTLSANTPVGVVQGFEYSDPINNRTFVCSQKLLAGAVSTLLYKGISVLVASDPNATFEIQANGSITAAQVGGAISMGGFGAADMVLGTSRIYADSATIDTASNSTKALKVVAISKEIGNVAGDSYTKLVVRWNAGVHQDTFAGAH